VDELDEAERFLSEDDYAEVLRRVRDCCITRLEDIAVGK
jgi:hypothetical protein